MKTTTRSILMKKLLLTLLAAASLSLSAARLHAQMLLNSSFESPAVAAGSYADGSGADWTTGGGSAYVFTNTSGYADPLSSDPREGISVQDVRRAEDSHHRHVLPAFQVNEVMRGQHVGRTFDEDEVGEVRAFLCTNQPALAAAPKMLTAAELPSSVAAERTRGACHGSWLLESPCQTSGIVRELALPNRSHTPRACPTGRVAGFVLLSEEAVQLLHTEQQVTG